MRDSVRLAADIYRPARDGEVVPGRFPTILYRTSYYKSRQVFADAARYFCRRGYVVVIQDLRGRGNSEGTGQYYHIYNVNEGKDGYDTVEWIAEQPWSNGKVGTIGSSHGGIVQSAMAMEDPPHLSAMFISQSASNPYKSGQRHNGALELRYAGHIMLHAMLSQEADADPQVQQALMENMMQFRDWLSRWPWKKGATPFSAVPKLEQIFFEFYTRGDYDEFWKHPCINYEEHYEQYADGASHAYGGGAQYGVRRPRAPIAHPAAHRPRRI
jgi:putative CocE/NonD family hydrolase